MHRSSGSRRAGFTAVELIVVIGIMMLLMGMAVPAVMPSIRHGTVVSAIGDLTTCWREAQALAVRHALPRGRVPAHFGIEITQAAGQQPTVALIFDNVAGGVAHRFMRGQDPLDAASYDPAGTPVALFRLNRGIAIAIGPQEAADAAPVVDGTVLIYAQFGTGLPISPEAVASGHGASASPVSLGVSSASAADSSVCRGMRVQTLDFENAARHRGYAASFAIYHAGFTAAREL